MTDTFNSFINPRSQNAGWIRRHPWWLAQVVALVGIIGTATIAWIVWDISRHELEATTQKEIDVRANQTQNMTEHGLFTVRSAAAIIQTIGGITEEEMNVISTAADPTKQHLNALAWATRTDGRVGGVREILKDGTIGKSTESIERILPMVASSHHLPQSVYGLDALTRFVIENGSYGEFVTVPNVDFLDDRPRFIIAAPVWDDAFVEDNGDGAAFGFVFGVFDASSIIQDVIKNRPAAGLNVEAYYLANGVGEPKLFFAHRSRTLGSADGYQWFRSLADTFSTTTSFYVGGHEWTLKGTPTINLVFRHIVQPLLVVLFIGCALTFAVVLSLVISIRSSQRLSETNQQLVNSRNELARTSAITTAIFRDVPAGMIITDLDNRIVSVNPGATKLFAVDEHRVIGQPFESLVCKDQFDCDNGMIFNHGSDEILPDTQKFAYHRPDGSTFLGETYPTIIHDEDGKPFGYLAVIRDVTVRDQTEQELQENRTFLDVLLNSIEDGIVACDANGVLKLFNRATMDFHGLPAEQLPAEEWSKHYDLYYADGVTPMEKEDIPLFRALDGELVKDAEMAIRPKNGAMKRLRATGQALVDADGRKIGAVVSMHDITDQRTAEEALRRSQRLEAVGKLTGGIAHDFNNLLGIILGNIGLLERMVGDDEKALKRVAAVRTATERGATLTRRLLGFSRHDATAGEATDVNDVIAGMEDILAKSLTSKIDVDFHPTQDVWITEIDPGDLSDAVVNLALNARDAMPQGGRLVIETENRTVSQAHNDQEPDIPAGEYVVVSVSDTGTGIKPELLDRVLEPFFTTKDESRGTGLGLSMVYGFAKRSRGSVKIYSEVGYGTRILLFLPRTVGAEVPHEPETDIVDLAPPRGTETVLVVDDEAPLLDIAEQILVDLGYRVLTAYDGFGALDVLEANPDIDLLFSDVIMPKGFDGFALAKRASVLRPDIKILLASGFTGKLVGDDADSDLARTMLPKPYDNRQLAHAVRSVLDGRQLQLGNSVGQAA